MKRKENTKELDTDPPLLIDDMTVNTENPKRMNKNNSSKVTG